MISRRDFLKTSALTSAGLTLTGCSSRLFTAKNKRPNIVLALADDWSWPHASIAGDPAIKTPTFDRLARNGILFNQGYVTSPSCTPSRASILTGQYHWRLEEGANLHSALPAKFGVYPDILEQAGYHVGYSHKGWAPGKFEKGGRTRNPAGPKYKDFDDFLSRRPDSKPFCYWFGSYDPHRDYEEQRGKRSGIDHKKIPVPPCLPDSSQVRSDMCDYDFEVERFDHDVAQIIDRLKQIGELDNTLFVMTSDNGMPFPRCKSNLYDLGTHVPLAISWPNVITPGRIVDDFVSLADLAPTFLEAAGLPVPADMTGKSLMNILKSNRNGRIEPARDFVLTGKERHHGLCRVGGVGYPSRAIRTYDYLYIRNFKPDRWPAGDPLILSSQGIYDDVDSGPTKTYMLLHQNDPKVIPLFEKAFGKRPAEELYDLKKDPGQMNNVAADPAYAGVLKNLSRKLTDELIKTADPRILGHGDAFDHYPYYAGYTSRKLTEPPVIY